jgi:4-amino-4-deoxy-L-arabinose transferase-like glycosyltransferase
MAPFALRLPSALATIVMAGAVGYVVARVGSPRAGLLSAIVLSTSLMQAIVGRLAIMDALLDLSVALAILAFFGAAQAPDRRVMRRRWLGGFLALALGVLAKGPVALAIVGLVVVPWIWWESRRGRPFARPSAVDWLLGIGLFALVAAPWFVVLGLRVGPAALAQLIGHYTFGRYLGTIENQTGPFWYYIPVLILGFFPWFAFAPPALALAFRAARTRGASLQRLCLVWAILPFVFFSLGQTKLPNYIALELPALAIVVALWFENLLVRQDRRGALVWAALVPATIGGLAIAISIFSRDMHLTADTQKVLGDLVALGSVVLAGSIGTFALLAVPRTVAIAPYALAGASVASILMVVLVAEPHAEPLKPIPQLARIVREQRLPGDIVAIQGVAGGNALLFYTQPHVATLDGPRGSGRADATDPKRAICGASRAFVVTSKKRPNPDPTYGRARRIVGVADGDILFLYDGPGCTEPS